MEVRAPMPAGWAPCAVGDSGGVGLPLAAPASAARRRPHWPYDSTVWSGPIVGTTMASRGGHWPQDDIRRLVAYAHDRGIRVVPEYGLNGSKR